MSFNKLKMTSPLFSKLSSFTSGSKNNGPWQGWVRQYAMRASLGSVCDSVSTHRSLRLRPKKGMKEYLRTLHIHVTNTHPTPRPWGVQAGLSVNQRMSYVSRLTRGRESSAKLHTHAPPTDGHSGTRPHWEEKSARASGPVGLTCCVESQQVGSYPGIIICVHKIVKPSQIWR